MQNEIPKANGHTTVPKHAASDSKSLPTAFGQPRKPLDTRYIYAVISQRANGLSIGVNLNPDKHCNFDCPYCEVDRDRPGLEPKVDVQSLGAELKQVLSQVYDGKLCELAGFSELPPELLQLKEVALSGDGEPTLCPNFDEVVGEVLRVRANGAFPHFKIVLITNATGLDSPVVRQGLKLLGKKDEIWAKLDVGTQEAMNRVNRSEVPLRQVLANILALAKRRPVVIQSLFPLMNGNEPSPDDIEQYVLRLNELKEAGAQIAMVQVYSAHRPPHRPDCAHLPLKTLSFIARRVRDVTGLKAEVF